MIIPSSHSRVGLRAKINIDLCLLSDRDLLNFDFIFDFIPQLFVPIDIFLRKHRVLGFIDCHLFFDF